MPAPVYECESSHLEQLQPHRDKTSPRTPSHAQAHSHLQQVAFLAECVLASLAAPRVRIRHQQPDGTACVFVLASVLVLVRVLVLSVLVLSGLVLSVLVLVLAVAAVVAVAGACQVELNKEAPQGQGLRHQTSSACLSALFAYLACYLVCLYLVRCLVRCGAEDRILQRATKEQARHAMSLLPRLPAYLLRALRHCCCSHNVAAQLKVDSR